MPEEEKFFSEEYVKNSETSSKNEENMQESTDLEIDSKKYGISKPIRIIVRGKVIHD